MSKEVELSSEYRSFDLAEEANRQIEIKKLQRAMLVDDIAELAGAIGRRDFKMLGRLVMRNKEQFERWDAAGFKRVPELVKMEIEQQQVGGI